ncbi:MULTISPECIES: TagK domain-containing protein [unclassified Burkholderia]|uniref:TagK domain-containing protein n=1 Tax=unclassified Burkholderia TaxID=2613784 RepID=UPI00158DE999|nr:MULTISPECIES: TagK domain-containing protein [unclassified Burkholderia]
MDFQMRSFRLPWRRQSDVSHTGLPRGNSHARPGHTVAAAPTVPADHSLPSPYADDLLGQLGIGGLERGARRSDPSSHTSIGAPDSTDVLIDTLHAQYWRALADPHASVTVEWASTAGEAEPITRTSAPDSQGCPDPRRDHDSIEAMLLGDRTLEDVFERLDEHSASLPEDEPVPEILHLFAPSDFRAEAVQHPPALTRREHHVLTMDSPLSAPLRKDED